MKIALIGCGQSKADGYSLARDLYTSQLFRAALAHAEAGDFEAVYILSAKHGLLQLQDAVRPYDYALTEKDDEERSFWGHRVMCQVARWHEAPFELHVYAGATYADPLNWQLPEFPGVTITEPLAGLGIGQRLAWFKERRVA